MTSVGPLLPNVAIDAADVEAGGDSDQPPKSGGNAAGGPADGMAKD
jgi:hypothetical protein